MNGAYLHLIVNHIPVLLLLFSIPVLVWGLIRQNKEFIKLSLIGFIVVGIMAVVAVQTGESAEEVVEEIPTVSHDMIEAHEEAGEVAQWLAIALSLGGIGGLFLMKKENSMFKSYLWILMVFSLVTAGSFIYTASEGGKINHPEIRSSASTSAVENDD